METKFECIGKGGSYELVGRALAAGTLKETVEQPIIVYKNDKGELFVRTEKDFIERMKVIENE